MKRIIILISVFLLLPVIAGCGIRETDSSSESRSVTIHLGGLKGPTSMGLVKLLDDCEQGLTANDYDFTMAASADELTPKFLKGDLDILIVPANLGAVLYSRTQAAVQTAAVSTLGVLYIVEKGGTTVHSLEDLKGQTVYASGKNTTPEYALDYLMEQYGLDPIRDVNVEWKTGADEVVAQLAAVDHGIAMLPQPYVTVASGKINNLHIAADLTQAWDQLDNGSRLVTASVIVRREFAQKYPEMMKTFLKEYGASTDFVNNYHREASVLIEKYGIVKAAVAEKAIPYCNMVCLTGEEMKTALGGYLDVLFSHFPNAVGGSLPGEDYYLLYE